MSFITPEEIQEILKQYRIGKKPLSKLLGWGETTVIRYLEGDIPSKEYSDKLKNIKQYTHCYYELLQANESLITHAAYEKSLKAIYENVTCSKMNTAAHYIRNNWDGDLPVEGLRSLLYFSQGLSLGLYGKKLFTEEYILTEQKIPYTILEQHFLKELYIPDGILEKELTNSEKELLESIVNAFGWYGYKTLVTIMTSENDNLRISRNKNNERIISYDTLERHFKWVVNEYRIYKSDDIRKYIDFKFAEIRGWKLLSSW